MAQKPSTIKPKLFQGDLDEETLNLYLQDFHLAVDCEMMGLNPKRDRLCLIQLSDSFNHYSVIQILPNQREAPRLKQLFENPEIIKVFHFARMDMLFLKVALGINVNNVFCTKIASKLARTYTDKHGLRDIVKEFFGESLDKTNQSSDWGKKTLTKEQIEYACEDVRYLIAIQYTFMDMLARESRLELAEKCFEFLPTQIELDLLEIKEIFEH